MLLVFLLYFPPFCEKTEAENFSSYIPFLCEIPEGSVGLFNSGNPLYKEVYPAGIYLILGSDSECNDSILPKRDVVSEAHCLTIDGVKIRFEKITDYYLVYHSEKGDRLFIWNPEISLPHIPDKCINKCTDLEWEANSYIQSYDLFYTLEGEQDAKKRHYKSDDYHRAGDRFFNDSAANELQSEESGRPLEDTTELAAHSDLTHGLDCMEWGPTQPAGQGEMQLNQDTIQGKHQTMQSLQDLWKHSSGRLYLTW